MKKKVGIVIGIKADAGYHEFWAKYPHIIGNIPDEHWQTSSSGIDSDWKLGHDAIVLSCLQYIKQDKFEFVPIWGPAMTLRKLNECEYIYSFYETGWWWSDHPLRVRHYESMMKKTTAMVIPSFEFQDAIIRKHKYMDLMVENNIPMIPTYNIDLMKFKRNKKKVVTELLDHVKEQEYDKILIKPEFEGFGNGIKTFTNFKEDTLIKFFEGYLKLHLEGALVQPYIESFSRNREYRTFWLNGKFRDGIAQYFYDAKGNRTFNYIKKDKLDKTILTRCKTFGKKIIKIIEKEYGMVPPFIRLDFGCCLDKKYFLNEIEFVPTLHLPNTNIRFVFDVADAIHKSVLASGKKRKKKLTHKK